MSTQLVVIAGRLIILAPILSLAAVVIDRVMHNGSREWFIKRALLMSQLLSIAGAIICSAWLFIGGEAIAIGEIQLLRLSTDNLFISLRIDALSASFVFMTCFLGAIVGLFASRYLHRDSGYFRFFVLYHIFLTGMQLIFQGAGLSTIYIGWELIGITSALLISFFSFRRQSVSNSLRAFWAYRVTDSGILIATLVAMHHGIERFTSDDPTHFQGVMLFGCLFSAVGKSAQFPFGRWLPKAMEGPTPSSAIFYGGLSVHAGMYLMLRVIDSYGLPNSVSVCMVMIGIFSVWYATTVGRIQSDAKSVLAYAAMAQVGLMFIEIALGFHALAIFHFVGHSLLRTYQLLNAASVLQDRYAFEHVLGRERVRVKVQNRPGQFAQYAYAFWESIDGAFGRLSLLNLAENISRLCRRYEQRFEEWVLWVSRLTLFYARLGITAARFGRHRTSNFRSKGSSEAGE